jgi:hypothetical protein
MIPKMNEVDEAARPEVLDARKAAELIARVEVHNNTQLQTAVSWIAEVKEKFEEVDKKRKSFVDPLKKVITEINDFFAPALDALGGAESTLKALVVEYVTESLKRSDAELAQVPNVESPAARAAIVKRAAELVPSKVNGLSVRESWTGPVSDTAALVQWAVANQRDELLLVDEKALAALTKAAGRDPQIPGWTAEVKCTVAITTSKVKK